jgi:hypothetical protein
MPTPVIITNQFLKFLTPRPPIMGPNMIFCEITNRGSKYQYTIKGRYILLILKKHSEFLLKPNIVDLSEEDN